TLGGLVNNSVFPVVMEVDYVRVYDGNRPYIVGNREVENAATGQIYRIRNIDPDTEVNWSVPSGATIVSGQGTSVISLDWGTSGGTVTAEIMLDCGVQNIALDVFMEPTFSRDFSFENFDDEALATLVFNDGDYSEVNNPDPNEVNNSNLVGRYVRDGNLQFDVIIYDVEGLIENADTYFAEEERFFIDVYTDAPIGTNIFLQLETDAAEPANFPTGRHSRYSASVQEQNAWQRLEFSPVDQPDQSAPANSITSMVLLFASSIFNGDTYYYDNLDSYGRLPVSVFSPSRLAIDLTISPNPTEDNTQVSFELKERANVTTSIFDINGKLVTQIEQGQLETGAQMLSISLSDLPAGVYHVQLNADNQYGMVRVVKK
ncbi:MAG: T9SS type A sorting domain-containing protein, partial [Bacteroidota bacterium]